MSSATAWVTTDLLKNLAIWPDTTVRRSAADRENLKPYWKSEKRLHFSRWPTFLLFISFFKDFINHKKKTNRADLSPTFLNTWITNETFQQSEKQHPFRQILTSSASMYESCGSQFFRTNTGIQSETEAYDESRFITTF